MARKKGLHLSVDLLRKQLRAEATAEDLNILDGCWRLHFKYGEYLVGVSFNSLLSDQVSEKFTGSYPECALLRVKLHIELLKESKRFIQVLHVIGVNETLYEHVVYVYLRRISD